MAFQPATNTIQVRIQAQLNGQQVENVFHVLTAGPPSLTEVGNAASIAHQWVIDSYAPISSSNILFTRVLATDMSVDGGAQSEAPFIPPLAGGTLDAVKTNQDTLAIKLGTGLAGRSYRGRFYVLAIPQGSYSSPNNVSAAYIALMLNAADELMSAWALEGLTWAVLSRVHNGVPRVAGISTPVVTISNTDSVVDSQNRRLPGRGS